MIHIVLGVVFKSSSCQIFRSYSSSIVTSACDVLPPKSFNTRATKGPHVVMIGKHNLEHNDLGPLHLWDLSSPSMAHSKAILSPTLWSQITNIFTSCIVSSCNSFSYFSPCFKLHIGIPWCSFTDFWTTIKLYTPHVMWSIVLFHMGMSFWGCHLATCEPYP
jgi:hypothetical protein